MMKKKGRQETHTQSPFPQCLPVPSRHTLRLGIYRWLLKASWTNGVQVWRCAFMRWTMRIPHLRITLYASLRGWIDRGHAQFTVDGVPSFVVRQKR